MGQFWETKYEGHDNGIDDVYLSMVAGHISGSADWTGARSRWKIRYTAAT